MSIIGINMDEVERQIAEVGPERSRPRTRWEAPERIETMDDAVRVASIEEVPQVARDMAQKMTAAMESVAAETEALAGLLMDKADQLRRANAQVCEDLQGVLAMGRRLAELTRANRAAYIEIGR